MVPCEADGAENIHRNNGENDQAHCLLNSAQLEQRKWSAHTCVANSVSRNHEQVLEERNKPANQNNPDNAEPFGTKLGGIAQVSIPGKRHEGIRDQQ